ncbi:hypothetical protein O2K51_05020 [Apibacter raozihei]|uniref:hypothetical protein n=1 Tax=Apibacter raozihei TaxID=2500547 RepID=UPI000FE3C4EA|nr:hypothetical protein [Apibacter raozihei]
MILNEIYVFFDPKYIPIINYFYIIPSESIESELDMIYRGIGCMRDFNGYEFENNGTITFFDFTTIEKSINITIPNLIIFINPIIQDFLKNNSEKKIVIDNYIDMLLNKY